MLVKIISIPLIGALIGYLTNVVAIKMLFWPRQPINLFFFQLYGLLPKRQADIATSLGELVENQLLSMDDLFAKIDTPEVKEEIVNRLVSLLKDRLATMLPRIVPARVTQIISDALEKVLRQEAGEIFRQALEWGRDYLTGEVQIRKIVEDKVNAYDLNELEDMIRGISSPELRFIEILGGVLGFMIGLVQLAINIFIPG